MAKIYLVKPTTFMNESGKAVHALPGLLWAWWEDLLVAYDDLDMVVGKFVSVKKGSAGGHNGIKSLIAHLKTQEFDRIKIGIGRPNQEWQLSIMSCPNLIRKTVLKLTKPLDKLDSAVNYYLQEKDLEKARWESLMVYESNWN